MTRPAFQAAARRSGEDGRECLPFGRGVAQAETLGGGGKDATLFEVGAGFGAALEAAAVEVGRFGVRFQQELAFAFLLCGFGGGERASGARHLHSRFSSECFHRLDEAQPFVFHEEGDGGAVRAAAEAVVELPGGRDGEGGRFFAVEGAAGEVVGAGFLELEALADDVDQVDAGEQLVDEVARDHGRTTNVRRRAIGVLG